MIYIDIIMNFDDLPHPDSVSHAPSVGHCGPGALFLQNGYVWVTFGQRILKPDSKVKSGSGVFFARTVTFGYVWFWRLQNGYNSGRLSWRDFDIAIGMRIGIRGCR